MSCADIRRVFDEVLAGYPESERAKRARSADRIVWQASEALKMTTPGGVILDIGAGHSLFAPVCAKLGLEVTIVDDFADSLEAPEMAGIRDHFDRIGVRVIMGDVFETKLPFAEESIDLVVTIDSIEHWHKSPKKLFQSLYEKIVPGGVLWVGAPNCVNLRKRVTMLWGRCKWSSMQDWYEEESFRGHVREPDIGDLAYIARSLGFSSYHIEGRNWLGYMNEQGLVRQAMPYLDPILQRRPGLCSNIFLYAVK